MTIYAGSPGFKVFKDGQPFIPLAIFSWGNTKPPPPGARLLAVALLFDVLQNEQMATQVRDRFMWRTIMGWGSTWTMTDSEIRGVVDEIRGTEKIAERARATMVNDIAPVASEGGRGPTGAQIVWGKDSNDG